MTESTQIRKNEFIDMLEISEQEFNDAGNFVHCDENGCQNRKRNLVEENFSEQKK